MCELNLNVTLALTSLLVTVVKHLTQLKKSNYLHWLIGSQDLVHSGLSSYASAEYHGGKSISWREQEARREKGIGYYVYPSKARILFCLCGS